MRSVDNNMMLTKPRGQQNRELLDDMAKRSDNLRYKVTIHTQRERLPEQLLPRAKEIALLLNILSKLLGDRRKDAFN